MAIRIGPLDADGLEDALVLADALEDAVLGVVVVDDELDDEPDEHPPMTNAMAATATPHAAKRARLSLNMVLSLPFREKGHASRYMVEASTDSAERNVSADSQLDQDL